MPPTQLFIAVPAYGESFYTPCVQTLFKLGIELERRHIRSILAAVSYADVAEGRNALLTHWFDKTDASHLLFVDADMGFEPQLIFDMLEFDKPIVGAIYPKRQIDLDRFAKAVNAGQSMDKASAASHDFVVQKPSRSSGRNGFVRVDGCGTGIMLVQRSCIEAMIAKLPAIVDKRAGLNLGKKSSRIIRAFEFLTVDGLRLSEDYSFCHRWREDCGGEIWANVSHAITHVGLRHFTARFSDAPGTGVRILEAPITLLPNQLSIKKSRPPLG
ncbi:hypothetical protein XH90_13285 [Bradyrhizobium sp. CCBAU 53338]|nr:hypothetical protein XH90_13285 [Bradyrhizobium sp. CCBAU 53338]